jgi:hypothetical protein
MSMSLDGCVADANDGVGRKLEGCAPPDWRWELAGAGVWLPISSSEAPSSGTPGSLAGAARARDEVLGSRWEQDAYDVVDAVWLKDERITEIVQDAV